MFLSRKFGLPDGMSLTCGGLQWGRDVSIPEMTRADARDGVVDQLQWGRDVSIPEILVKASVPCVLVVLQWGRDVSIPEMRPDFIGTGPARGFNGAGMFLSRK